MSQLLAIKERIRTITNLRKVTRAMELVTRTKINRARSNATSARRFQLLFRELFDQATGAAEQDWRASVARRVSDAQRTTTGNLPRRLVVGVLSQKGFCGAFNERVLAALQRLLGELSAEAGAEISLTLIGRRNSKWSYALKREFAHIPAPEKEYAAQIAPLAEELADRVLEGGDVEVYLVFNELVSILEQKPIVLRVFPADDPAVPEGPATSENSASEPLASPTDMIFEPAPEQLMPALVPAYLRACLERAYWETVAGENCARLLSMKNANDNASKMLDALQLEYNKTRQTRITQELSEIVSAFDVLRSIQERHNREEE